MHDSAVSAASDDDRGQARMFGQSMTATSTERVFARHSQRPVLKNLGVGHADTLGWAASLTLKESRKRSFRHRSLRIGPAPSGLTIAITAMPDREEPIIGRRLHEHESTMRATVEGIKKLAETEQ